MGEDKKLKVCLSTISILLVLITISIGLTNTLSYAKEKVQYKAIQITYGAGNIQSVLDKLSNEGWELVTHHSDILIFKKEGAVTASSDPERGALLPLKVKCPKCGAVFSQDEASRGISGQDLGKCPRCGAVFKKGDNLIK